VTFASDWGFQGDSQPSGLEAMLHGRADRPFVYRRLSADAIRGISWTAEHVLKPHTLGFVEDSSPVRQFAVPGESWNRQKALDFHAVYAFVFLCYLARDELRNRSIAFPSLYAAGCAGASVLGQRRLPRVTV
jgi:hypothetical protein